MTIGTRWLVTIVCLLLAACGESHTGDSCNRPGCNDAKDKHMAPGDARVPASSDGGSWSADRGIDAGTAHVASDAGEGATRPAAQMDRFADCDAFLAYARSHADEMIDASPSGAPFPEPFNCPSGVACDIFPQSGEFTFPQPWWEPTDPSGSERGLVRVQDGIVYFWHFGRLMRLPLDGAAADLSMLADVGPAESLFVAEKRALLISSKTLLEVDISDATAMKVVRKWEIAGKSLGAARIGQSVRIAVQSRPRIEWQIAGTGGAFGTISSSDPDEVAAAREHNHALVRNSTAADWLPTYTETDASGDVRKNLPLLDCAAVLTPTERGGMSILSFIDVDVAQGLADVRAAGLIAEGATVYGDGSRPWITTRPWAQLSDQWELPHADATRAPTILLHAFEGPLDGFRRLGTAALPGRVVELTEAADAAGAFVLTRRDVMPDQWADEFDATLSFVALQDESLKIAGTTDPFTLVRPSGMALSGSMLLIPSGMNEVPTHRVDVTTPSAPLEHGTTELYGPWTKLFPLADGRVAALGRKVDKNWNYDAAESYLKLLSGDKVDESFDLGPFQPETRDPNGFSFDAATETLVTCGETDSGGLIVGIDCHAFDVGAGSAKKLATIVHPDPGLQNYGYRKIHALGIAQGQLITVSQTQLRVTNLSSMKEHEVGLPFPPAQ